MDAQTAAELQVVLEGVDLPASKQALVEYAHSQDEQAARSLVALPEREYRSLDEVGEALSPVQPSSSDPAVEPREESDQPPGGDDYTNANPQSGAVRPSAPASNPPEKAIEQQSKTQKQQMERQKQLG